MKIQNRLVNRVVVAMIAVGLTATATYAADMNKTAITPASEKKMTSDRPVAEQLKKMSDASVEKMPQLAAMTRSANDEIMKAGAMKKPLKVGDRIPSFTLPDPDGKLVSSDALLAKGPLVVVFYRGAWCPYCNIHLRGMQKFLPQIMAAGGTLVAISGETPEKSDEVATADSLTYPVLSDTSFVAAQKFGLVYDVPMAMSEAYKGFGLDLAKYYGNEKAELVVPATYVIGKDGVITYAYVELDYTMRAEPMDVVAALAKLKK